MCCRSLLLRTIKREISCAIGQSLKINYAGDRWRSLVGGLCEVRLRGFFASIKIPFAAQGSADQRQVEAVDGPSAASQYASQ